MDAKGDGIADRVNKLKKFNSYENMLLLARKVLSLVVQEEVNVMEFRAIVRSLADSIIREVMESEKFFIRMLSYIETPDRFAAHCLNTAIYACIFCINSEIEPESISKVITAALLHDIGKLEFPEKVRPVYMGHHEDPQQAAKYHSIWGHRLLTHHLKFHPDIAAMVLKHHEQIDGSGTPDGLTEKDLSLADQIIITANLVDLVLQKTNFSGIESVKLTINRLLETQGGKFSTPVRNMLIELYSLKENVRKYKRYKYGCKGYIEDTFSDIKIPCAIENISAGGLRIRTAAELSGVKVYKINAKLSDNLMLKDKMCKVAWHFKDQESYVSGMRFNAADEASIRALESLFIGKKTAP